MILVIKFLFPKGYVGIAIFPFVILKNKTLANDHVLINHERIHLRQQLEMLVLPFFLFYVMEFIVRFIQFGKWHPAYRNISFEREAYINEKDLDYLKRRKFWNCWKYV